MGLEIALLAVSLVGTGVAAYGQYQQGKTQNAIAGMNSLAQERNARVALMTTQAQMAAQKQAAAAQFSMRAQEAKAAENNALSIEAQAINQSRIDRANSSRKSLDNKRMLGEQRAAIVGSGIVESSGTPLDLIAETVRTMQLSQEEDHYASGMQRESIFREAAMTRLGGQMALAGATLDRSSSLLSANLLGATGRAQYNAGKYDAQITRLSGQAAQSASRWQAGATLFSGVSQGLQGYSAS